ncbi:uncharacterized protein LOC116332017 [Oreochromis aureus]|uniref:uncharacterized protein LOC116332017 n=1 Tax=Oreochromis aureus TaxID=47969 RepID=UPI0012BC187E|nr:uncharacterized protein LOC116332017 [Oreochromis aureus]XP_039458045.1 uncharacterized protein LOC116332017 [Oreochromis aureus]
MIDNEIVLEALGVICNAEVTSLQQKQRSEVDIVPFLLGALKNLFIAAETQLPITQLISTVVDGDQTCSVSQSSLSRILYGEQVSGERPGSQNEHVSEFEVDKKRRFIIDEEEFFDPRFHYDFTEMKDTDNFYRGDEEYRRPYGWKRYALKVLDKYDGNEWLGTAGYRTWSVSGEWPVSYHGTSYDSACEIIKGRFKPGWINLYGRGVYSAPDITEALAYCKDFKSKKNGKTYKVILQNRINPSYREKWNNDKYWLVRIDRGSSEEEEGKMVERAIRPYGLLLKEF